MNTVYGIHSVEETLKSRPKGVHYVAMARERNDIKLKRILEGCRTNGIQVRFVEKKELERLRRSVEHVAALHDDAMDFIENGIRDMIALRDALTRAADEVKAARVALEAATAQEGALRAS